jgi:gluconolactonase
MDGYTFVVRPNLCVSISPNREAKIMLNRFVAVSFALLVLCSPSSADDAKFPSMGSIERKDPRFDKLVPPGAKIERLTDAVADWAEGPVWVSSGKYLLFSDIPKNTIWKFKDGDGLSQYLKPSGYTGNDSFKGREPGSNGLTLDASGRLVMCQHGDRRIARQEKDGKITILADRFEGKRFNSPNDLCFKSNGDLYFTDPPYGLPGGMKDPAKELDFQGVYRLTPSGEVTLLTKDMSRPNGIAFSPDEKTLYVANSDSENAVWMAYPVKADGTLGAGKVFFDATAWMKAKKKGAPDGMKVDRDGNLFATGPGGVCVFAPDGTHLGTIDTGEPTANCAWGDDGSVLYMTANKYLCRIKTATKGKLP